MWKAASRPPRMRMVVSNKLTVVSCSAETMTRPSTAGRLLGCRVQRLHGPGEFGAPLLHVRCSMSCRWQLLGPAALPMLS